MSQTLLVCMHLAREKFEYEHYQGRDDILALVESGSFWVDDGRGRQIVAPLEAVCFREGIAYERHVIEPVVLYLFRFHGGTNILPSGKLTFRDTQRIRSTIGLLQASDTAGYYNDFDFKQVLFNDLLNQYRLENPKEIQTLAKSDPVISDAMVQINATLHEKLRLPELAEKYFLSYVQFSRRFKAAVGTTVQDYITEMRLKKAMMLLADSDLTVKEIARNCGFANEYYFSNFFREHQKLSPTEFRGLAKSTEIL